VRTGGDIDKGSGSMERQNLTHLIYLRHQWSCSVLYWGQPHPIKTKKSGRIVPKGRKGCIPEIPSTSGAALGTESGAGIW